METLSELFILNLALKPVYKESAFLDAKTGGRQMRIGYPEMGLLGYGARPFVDIFSRSEGGRLHGRLKRRHSSLKVV